MTFLTHLDEATIQRLVEGLLPDAEASAAKTHIDHCAPCRRRSGEVSALITALSAEPALPAPPVDFMAAVMARVDREPGLLSEAIRPRVVASAIAAGLAVAGTGALLVGGAESAIPAADIATAFTALVGRASLVRAIVQAGAPLAAAVSLATLAALSPFIVKAIQSVQPRASRVAVRS